jgi:O-antigen biosynthesis protein
METTSLSNQNVLIIAGMHRSGTSLTASFLQSSGLDIGDNLMSSGEGNEKGHFEDLDFVHFHERVLYSQGMRTEGWTLSQRINVQEQYIQQAQTLLEQRSSKVSWGWKDPRTTLFLDFWLGMIPNAKFVFIYRSPWETVDSLYRRNSTDETFFNNPNFALELWMTYNQAILDFYRRYPERCLLANIQTVIHSFDTIIEQINQKLQIKLDHSFQQELYDSKLFKQQNSNSYRIYLINQYFPEVISLLNQLNQKSDFSNDLQELVNQSEQEIKSTLKAWILQDWLDIRKIGKESQIIKTQLQETETQLQETETQLQETETQLQETETQLQSQIYHYQLELQKAQITIAAMETSKFWKLRTIWFKFKHLLKLQFITKYLSQLKLIFTLISSYGTGYTINLLKQENFIPLSDDLNYQKWLTLHYPKKTDLIQITENLKNLSYKPVISIIIPVFNTPENFLREAIESVLNQIYPYWELCIADDTSTKPYVKNILTEYANKDKRIKVVFREENGHISQSSNSALELATGEYIALLDHDDLLTPNALYEVVELLNQHPEADMIYSDEDKINDSGKLQDPFFKPDWCPDSFLSRMYISHLGVYRRNIINEIGGFRVGYEGSQDYDLVLRFTEKTDKIFHIPRVLYHWRIHSESTAQDISTKNYATDAAQKALQDALERRGEPGKVIPVVGGHHIIRYEIKNADLVSIIIPTKNLGKILNTCLKSIFEKTTYPNYEVLVIDNGSDEEETKQIIQSWKEKEPQRFRCELLDIPFNFSKINNHGVQQTKGKYLLFLNNDTEVINDDWLTAMVEQAQRPSIGAVGALLLYQDNTIQHAGVVAGIGGVAGHSHKYYDGEAHGYFNQLKTVNNYSAVTAACLMCRREVFEEVGGFEETLVVAFNDVDICFKMIDHGYRNIYLPHVQLHHYESKSRGYEDTPEKQARFSKEIKYMQSKWQKLIAHDPCYSPNLTRSAEDYSINCNF